MKIVLVTLITPYKENLRGTSALAYHLIKGRKNDLDVTIYSFNGNRLSDEQIKEVDKELNVKIIRVGLPRWYRWMIQSRLLFLRIFLRYPFVNYITLPKQIVEEIKSLKPDMIWVNNEEMSRIVKQFPDFRRVQLGPDVESLYYYRMMSRRFVMNSSFNYWKCAMMYRKYARLERNFCNDDNFTYYAVGKADIEHLRQINPNVKSQFLCHPHYDVCNKKLAYFHHPKIKLLIAGRNDLYMQQCADELIPIIENYAIKLKDFYEITFLGKGWENHVKSLLKAGYCVNHLTFAPNYIDEVCKHDIQLTPICIGTGTKGKVLDALANGLLVMGTSFALENIAVKHGESCIVWNNCKEVPDILLDIEINREKYEQIAVRGRDVVLFEHNPNRVSQVFF